MLYKLIKNMYNFTAPPLSIAFKNLDVVEDNQDYESGNVTFELTYDGGFNANVTVQCEQIDTRPEASVTWMIGTGFFLFSNLLN